MADYKVTDTEMVSVANAIRTKGGTSEQLEWPTGFANAVAAIPSGGSATLIEKSVTQNGTYNASSDNADGYSKVVVNVSGGGGDFPHGEPVGQYEFETNLYSWETYVEEVS